MRRPAPQGQKRLTTGEHGTADFDPEILRIRETPPHPLAGAVLWVLVVLLAAALLWSVLARLDIVAVADGKLVPGGYLKIVQPADAGVVKEILVAEGDVVTEGQALIRMDSVLSDADWKAAFLEYHAKRLALRRVDAQLAGTAFARSSDDPSNPNFETLYGRVGAQYQANVHAYRTQLEQEKSLLEKARHDLAAAEEVRAKLVSVLPHYRAQETAYEKLNRDGYAGRLLYTDKQRERFEKEQDLRTQEFAIAASQSSIAQSQQKIVQLTADYRRLLQTERVEASSQLERATMEFSKTEHRRGLLELKAPQAGIVKDLATHTPGTVVSPGTILMTLVPSDQPLRAEVWISNQDIGFLERGQGVRVKLSAFPFQKYGMVDGKLTQLSADASELPTSAVRPASERTGGLFFRALVDLNKPFLEVDARRYPLAAGMQVTVEAHLGDRRAIEYLLAPLQRAWHDAGRER
jgi:hemolysin D